MSAAQLAQYEGERVIIDCRFSLADPSLGEKLYQQSHIAGAYYLHLDRDLSAPKQEHGGRHPLPDLSAFAAKLRAMGVSRDTLVVAYDDSKFGFAARCWWLLRQLGHAKVKLLNGGFKAWCDANLPLSAQPPPAAHGDIEPAEPLGATVDINEVKTVPLLHGHVLVDSREERRFLGYEEPMDPVAGHINGAVNLPWQSVTDEQGFLLSPESLRQRWQPWLDSEIVAYCGSGVSACVNLLSLVELGVENAKLYPGSWSDWCSYLEHPAVPSAK
jgi:thiosulfate/3-mercaptopyruvate sulfurtransferase